jgi:hypothetical protein
VHGSEPFESERLPRADRPEERNVARAERVDARVELAGRQRARRGRIADQRDGEPGQGARQACADRPAADDDEVVIPWVYNAAP